MGHERIGFIPKTKQWQSIIAQLQNYYGDKKAVAKIAADTLDAIKEFYNMLPHDPSIIASIRFLATLCHFSASADKLKEKGIISDSSVTLYSLLRGADQYISTDCESMETSKLAKDSLMNAIISYEQVHETNQISFAGFDEKSAWSNLDSGSAFCELARSFVAEYTERNLNYYLERAAAGEIHNYSDLVLFNQVLENQSKAIATHSKDISKLMQSFAAGWYNKQANQQAHSDDTIKRFLTVTFKKIKEEFRREGAGE